MRTVGIKSESTMPVNANRRRPREPEAEFVQKRRRVMTDFLQPCVMKAVVKQDEEFTRKRSFITQYLFQMLENLEDLVQVSNVSAEQTLVNCPNQNDGQLNAVLIQLQLFCSSSFIGGGMSPSQYSWSRLVGFTHYYMWSYPRQFKNKIDALYQYFRKL